jgi:adenosine deaminase
VGINLVQAEDDIISVRDYQKQMSVFNNLHNLYPNVHVSLHAGELSPTAVAPKDLRFHINEAVFTGNAERIGHGVSIAYEDNVESLLKHMAQKPVPVEINLTSNRKILNIYGKNHPLNYYLSHNVPVILSTDDEGVLRTDLTREYVAAVINHGLDYPALKNINRNALTYSFLPGKSLWKNPSSAVPVSQCKQLKSTSCQKFIEKNEKARLQRLLEIKLYDFEKQI